MAPTEERKVIIVGSTTTSTVARAIASATDAGLTVIDHTPSTITPTGLPPMFKDTFELSNTPMVSSFPDKKTRWGRSEMRKMAKEAKSMHKAAHTCLKNRKKRKKKRKK